MTSTDIETLFEAGTHFGYSRARRHPSATPFIFATKDRGDIFDLEETNRRLEAALERVLDIARHGKKVLFVGGKHEASGVITEAAERVGAPYVAGRWIGGTLTNFKNIRKRIERLNTLVKERASGELDKYTKRERLLLGREIEELEGRFGGLVGMEDIPGALFVVDSRHEETAVREANQLGIPVIALASSDCDFSMIQLPIPGNDASNRTIRLVVERVADAVQEGKRSQIVKTRDQNETAQ